MTILTRLLVVSLLCGWSTASVAHDYTIALDATLTTMTVAARFDRPVDYISARSRYARRYLHDVRDCDTGEKLATRDRRLELPAGGIRCLHYSVSLRGADRDASKIVISPALWMWRPRLGREDEILVTFELPGDADVFVPWESVGAPHQYRLHPSPESGTATAIFGAFEQHVGQVAGTELRIVLLGDRPGVELERFVSWIHSTAENIAASYGRFPNPDTNVILIPVSRWAWGDSRAVSFGRVIRDGGETIELMINPDRPLSDFYTEWTPTHEFSHLMLPYLDRRHRWISEGFAQYYQNVLLARAGQQSADETWQKILNGFERGYESAPGASPNAAASGRMRDTRMKVYWSGAALALMADVELRRRSGGRESLDTVLDRMQRCCLPSQRSWTGIELFQQFDALLDEPLFMALYEQYANADGFPDVRPVLTRLGVAINGHELELDDTAEFAAIRDAITH